MGMAGEAVTRRVLAVLIMMMAAALTVADAAAIHKVGDTAGWTTIGNVDYKGWAATRTFKIGDVVVFEYNPQFHNVMRVTHAMYRDCNASAPLATYTSGNDSIKITNRGHHFFFCGVPGHCQSGQKLDINVLRTSATAAAPTPANAPVDSDSDVPAATVPAPSPRPSKAVAIKAPQVIDVMIPVFGLLLFWIVGLLG